MYLVLSSFMIAFMQDHVFLLKMRRIAPSNALLRYRLDEVFDGHIHNP